MHEEKGGRREEGGGRRGEGGGEVFTLFRIVELVDDNIELVLSLSRHTRRPPTQYAVC